MADISSGQALDGYGLLSNTWIRTSSMSRPKRFILVPPAPHPAAAASPDPSDTRTQEKMRDLQRAVDEVITAAETVLPSNAVRGAQPLTLRELDDALASEIADLDPSSVELLEQALDETCVAGSPLPGEVEPAHGAARCDARPPDSIESTSRVANDRRRRAGTRYDRANASGGRVSESSRRERAAEFARALRDGPGGAAGSRMLAPNAILAPDSTLLHASPFSRAIGFIHAALTVVHLPLRLVPATWRGVVNWLAISLALWTPIVWLIAVLLGR